MNLDKTIKMLREPKAEAEFSLKKYMFYDSSKSLSQTLGIFCHSMQLFLFIPGMFITNYGSRMVSVGLIVMKCVNEVDKNWYVNSVISVEEFEKIYCSLLPLDIVLSKELDLNGNPVNEKRDNFLKLTFEIEEKCKEGSFGVEIQPVDNPVRIFCSKEENKETDLIIIGFRIDHL